MSPSQRSPNEPVSLDVNEQLALKIEGVIRQGGTGGATLENENPVMSGNQCFGYQQRSSKPKAFRRISEITVTVTSSHAVGKHQSHGLSKVGFAINSVAFKLCCLSTRLLNQPYPILVRDWRARMREYSRTANLTFKSFQTKDS